MATIMGFTVSDSHIQCNHNSTIVNFLHDVAVSDSHIQCNHKMFFGGALTDATVSDSHI